MLVRFSGQERLPVGFEESRADSEHENPRRVRSQRRPGRWIGELLLHRLDLLLESRDDQVRRSLAAVIEPHGLQVALLADQNPACVDQCRSWRYRQQQKEQQQARRRRVSVIAARSPSVVRGKVTTGSSQSRAACMRIL